MKFVRNNTITVVMALILVAVVGSAIAYATNKGNSPKHTDNTVIGEGSSSNAPSHEHGHHHDHGNTDTQVRGVQQSRVPMQANAASKAPTDKSAKETGKDFVISGALPALYPGAVASLPLTVVNDNNFPLTITSLSGQVASTSSPQCPTATVLIDDFAGEWMVAKNSTATTSLQIRMDPDAPNACQGVTYNLVYSGIGTK